MNKSDKRWRRKYRLWKRDGGYTVLGEKWAPCAYCKIGFPLGQLTEDHVRPRSAGGGGACNNLVLACAPCNHAKGSYVPPKHECASRNVTWPIPQMGNATNAI